MEAVCYTETSVLTYLTERFYNPKDYGLNFYLRKKSKSYDRRLISV
jgi:hypothetical protein